MRVLRLSVKVTSIVGLLLFTPCAPEAEVSPGAAPKAAPPVAPRVAKIGFLFIGSPGATATAWLEALRGGLAALGYVVLKPRFGEDSLERLDAAAAELTRGGVDLIVTAGDAAVRAARRATQDPTNRRSAHRGLVETARRPASRDRAGT